MSFCSPGDNRALHDALQRQQTTETMAIMGRSSGHTFATASLAGGGEEGDATPLATGEQPPANSSKPLEAAVIPTHESLMAIKHKKKLLTNGTEQFNMKPSKVKN